MTKLKDFRVKPLQRFFKPYFSPHTDSYEIEYVYGGRMEAHDAETGCLSYEDRNYFMCININTKYLLVRALPMGANRRLNHSMAAISQIITEIKMMNPNQTIKHIREDADLAFGKIVQKNGIVSDDANVSLEPTSYRPNVFVTYL
jgi:hypothetical protein